MQNPSHPSTSLHIDNLSDSSRGEGFSIRALSSGSPARPALDPVLTGEQDGAPISITCSDYSPSGDGPGRPIPLSTSPRAASGSTSGSTPVDRILDDREVPERVGILDDQLSPMVNRAVKFSFAIKENKHHTPRHSSNYKAKFRFQQKGSMRQRPRRRDSLEIIRQDRARQALTQKCLEIMSRGCVVTKYNRFGNPCRRIITVDKDGTEIRWESSFEHESRKKGIGFMARKARLRQLADITGVIYSSLVEFAHRKSRFYQYNQQGHPPWLCLTVLFDQETLDLVFKNEEEVDTWFFGLQNLAPMSKFYLPRGPQLIFRAQLKIEYESKRTGKPILEILVVLLKQAKDMVKKETEEREKEEKLAKVVIEGLLKKKSPKEVLGKHIWQNRYFRLEQTPDYMHSRLVYSREKGSVIEGNLPLANIKCVTLMERKKEGRLDIELRGGMVEDQRMLALLATDEGKAKEWRDALSRILTLMSTIPTQTENKFWYVTPDAQDSSGKVKKIVRKEKETVGMDDHERKHVHFQDEVRLVPSSSTLQPPTESRRSVIVPDKVRTSKDDHGERDLESGNSSSENSRVGADGEENDGQTPSDLSHPRVAAGLGSLSIPLPSKPQPPPPPSHSHSHSISHPPHSTSHPISSLSHPSTNGEHPSHLTSSNHSSSSSSSGGAGGLLGPFRPSHPPPVPHHHNSNSQIPTYLSSGHTSGIPTGIHTAIPSGVVPALSASLGGSGDRTGGTGGGPGGLSGGSGGPGTGSGTVYGGSSGPGSFRSSLISNPTTTTDMRSSLILSKGPPPIPVGRTSLSSTS